MTVYIFTGPTLSEAEARTVLDAVYLPPVAAGHVYQVARRGPRAIGIIDGHLHRIPAVWHKEILWAMSQGVHVFGSAGVGALRAAELAAFGMQGVGEVFQAYLNGAVEDDDEVAVAYGPAESGYDRRSDAMFDIRATLAAAEADGVLSSVTRLELERIAKALHYSERSYASMLQLAAGHDLPPTELAAWREWLPRGRVEVKRQDALAMLRVIHELLAADTARKRVEYQIEPTTNWDQAMRYWERTTRDEGGSHDPAAAREA